MALKDELKAPFAVQTLIGPLLVVLFTQKTEL
jgi:hypothetical protein